MIIHLDIDLGFTVKSVKSLKIVTHISFYRFGEPIFKMGNQVVYIGLWVDIDFHDTDNFSNNIMQDQKIFHANKGTIPFFTNRVT